MHKAGWARGVHYTCPLRGRRADRGGGGGGGPIARCLRRVASRSRRGLRSHRPRRHRTTLARSCSPVGGTAAGRGPTGERTR